ncbi:GntR family transcriptional regulator [Comamonas odontotermitis]|uniref:GntR family transcriptional regulator n=1 Tax=Comamonas odontotermitis TaxID=379895 RepID=UPI00366D581A
MSTSPPPSKPTLFQTLPLQVADQMASSIMDGTFAPGSRLREVELAQFFEVSRATIREALRHLEQRDLVRIQPQKGAYVTLLSAKELDDLFEVRASLLATGSRLAAGRCTNEDAQKLQAKLTQLRESVADLDAYVRASSGMVEMLIQLSDNDVLAKFVRDFAEQIGRYVRLGLALEANRKRSLSNWKRLVEAVVQHRAEEAAILHRDLALANRSAALAEFQRQYKSEIAPAPI